MNQDKDKKINIYLSCGFSTGLIFGIVSSIVPNFNTGIGIAIGMLSGLAIAALINYFRKKR